MQKTGRKGEAGPKKPDQPAAPVKRKSAPEAKEEELRPYSSPPCMMGELDEILDERPAPRK